MEQNDPPNKKVTITRLRTGCWTCRRRGYRCDEEKPVCKTCRRLDVPCEGYGVRLKWQHGRSTAGIADARPAPDRSPDRSGRRKRHKSETIGDALAEPSTAAAQDSSLVLTAPMAILPARNATDAFLLQHFFFTVSSLLSSTPDRTINTYISTILPLSFGDDCLLNTVLALSAIHLGHRYPDRFALYGESLKGAGMRGLIRRLDHTGERPWDEGILATIIMFGILEVFEANASLWSRHLEGAGSLLAAYLGRPGTATPQLARLEAASGRYASLTSRKLIEIYAYHEVLASIALCRAPRLPASFLQGSRSAAARGSPAGSGADAGMDGLPADGVDGRHGQWSAFADGPERKTVFLSAVDSLLSLVAELARLRSSADASSSEARRSAFQIVERLRRWRCPDIQYSLETRNTAEAMRQAGILFYYLASTYAHASVTSDGVALGVNVWETTDDDAEPSQAVETIIQCIAPISARHSAVASHTWPLYMAGLHAKHDHQRLFIRERLDEMIAVRGMKSTMQVREMLGRTWCGEGRLQQSVHPGWAAGVLYFFDLCVCTFAWNKTRGVFKAGKPCRLID